MNITEDNITLIEIIDLSSNINSPKLYARKVWQILFEYYQNNNGDMKDLDNLLCDYDRLAKTFKEGKGKNIILYWSFIGCTTTMAGSYIDSLVDEDYLRIKCAFSEDKITIHRFTNKRRMLFKNSSGAQTFLESYDGHDLYFDPQGFFPTVIARFGNEASEYKSGLAFADSDKHLEKARDLAIEAGLLVRPKV